MTEPVRPARLQVIRFFTAYEPDPADAGKMRAVDYVEYCPLGASGYSVTTERVSRLSKLLPNTGANPAVLAAHERWAAIGPKYEAWRAGQEFVEDGTPLHAWNGLSREMADLLAIKRIRTIEELADLTDAHIERMGIPNLRGLIEGAKRFMAGRDQSRVAEELRRKDEEIDAIRAEMAEMKRLLVAEMAETEDEGAPEGDAPRRRGRPRKMVAEAA